MTIDDREYIIELERFRLDEEEKQQQFNELKKRLENATPLKKLKLWRYAQQQQTVATQLLWVPGISMYAIGIAFISVIYVFQMRSIYLPPRLLSAPKNIFVLTTLALILNFSIYKLLQLSSMKKQSIERIKFATALIVWPTIFFMIQYLIKWSA